MEKTFVKSCEKSNCTCQLSVLASTSVTGVHSFDCQPCLNPENVNENYGDKS